VEFEPGEHEQHLSMARGGRPNTAPSALRGLATAAAQSPPLHSCPQNRSQIVTGCARPSLLDRQAWRPEPGEMRIGRWTYRAAPSSTFTTAAPDSSTPTASSPHPARDTNTTSPAPVSMNTAGNARSTPAAGSRATRFTIATR